MAVHRPVLAADIWLTNVPAGGETPSRAVALAPARGAERRAPPGIDARRQRPTARKNEQAGRGAWSIMRDCGTLTAHLTSMTTPRRHGMPRAISKSHASRAKGLPDLSLSPRRPAFNLTIHFVQKSILSLCHLTTGVLNFGVCVSRRGKNFHLPYFSGTIPPTSKTCRSYYSLVFQVCMLHSLRPS
jgi:hypothetical protein